MLLKSLKLENIRSYTSEQIEFSQGTTLLSGDIGAGKSTILLAIEFALFGILPGELSGGALLRNGKKKASIELNFEINNQDITIHRTLKKTKDSVTQGNGYTIQNRIKKDMTPVELKTSMFSLLGYPKELVSKSKNMIYRYTVYTPQEEMKRIIQEKPEERLDILRKLFDIDKYKRIQENTTTYIRKIKESQKEKAGMTADLDEKNKQRKQRQKEFNEAEKSIQEIKPKTEEAKKKTQYKKKAINDLEEKQKKLNELQKTIAVTHAGIQSKKEQSKRNEQQITELQKQIKQIKTEIENKEIKEVSADQIKEINQKITAIENEIKALNIKKAGHDQDKKRSQELKNKISEMNNCPTCLQIVDNTHKKNIADKENEKIHNSILHIDKYDQKTKEKEKELENLKKQLQEIQRIEKEQAVIRLKKTSLEDKQKQEQSLKKQQQETQEKIKQLEQEKNKSEKEAQKYTGIEKEYTEQEKELNYFVEQEKKQEIAYHRAIEKKQNIQSIITELDQEITKKQKIQKELNNLQDTKTWLQDYFLKLTETIEKQVMTRVYYEFNELLQTWFDALVEDETLTCRLDHNFTPLVIQNGYETELNSLSGGEKTACALAYRLALNKVINDLITTIHTKDLLILDEPTDGFSSEQLDQMREVLEQLEMKQIILVSHESKIETFVDKVIHISKNEHISEIIPA